MQLVTGGLFFAAAIWGVVDAVRHFKPEVPAGPPASNNKTSFRVTPLGVAPPKPTAIWRWWIKRRWMIHGANYNRWQICTVHPFCRQCHWLTEASK